MILMNLAPKPPPPIDEERSLYRMMLYYLRADQKGEAPAEDSHSQIIYYIQSTVEGWREGLKFRVRNKWGRMTLVTGHPGYMPHLFIDKTGHPPPPQYPPIIDGHAVL